ncbi:MAG: insulinase family protein [Ignavibacteriales bacterium]|nr:insulinase family protein [Ignavibacteriales bacterium]MBK7980129.1 insulinase family protein [Ignavibacteriota bacterium]
MNIYNVTKLSNGIRIASEKIEHVNSFSLGFWFNVGSRDETKDTNGISHLIEHMFFKGTKKRSASRISKDIESLGGYLNAFTSKEHTCFYGRGMTKNIEKTFSVLSDMIQDSLFLPKELAKESKVVIDELYDIEDSPEELIFDKFETNIFAGNKLEFPIIGTEENISKFKQNDLLKYIDEHYSINNFYIIASGNIDHEQLIKLTNKYIYKLKSGKRKIRKSFNPKKVNDLFVQKDINQAHLIFGGITYGYVNTDRAISNLITNILGEGSSSRLFLSLRERNGIAYQINSFMNSFYDISTFGVYFSTNESSLKKAKKIVEIEFDKLLQKGVTDKELQSAKEYIKGHVQMSLESTSNRMMRMGNSLMYFDKIKTLEESIAEIDAVSKNDILNYSQILLNPENLSSVLISSKNINI